MEIHGAYCISEGLRVNRNILWCGTKSVLRQTPAGILPWSKLIFVQSFEKIVVSSSKAIQLSILYSTVWNCSNYSLTFLVLIFPHVTVLHTILGSCSWNMSKSLLLLCSRSWHLHYGKSKQECCLRRCKHAAILKNYCFPKLLLAYICVSPIFCTLSLQRMKWFQMSPISKWFDL